MNLVDTVQPLRVVGQSTDLQPGVSKNPKSQWGPLDPTPSFSGWEGTLRSPMGEPRPEPQGPPPWTGVLSSFQGLWLLWAEQGGVWPGGGS